MNQSLKKAVVINDQAFACEGIVNYLRTKGFEVCGWAATRENAIQTVDESYPDLIVMEIILTTDLCLDLIDKFRKLRPSTKVLVVSRHSERVFAERSLRCGAHGFVSLMTDTKQVDLAINTVMSGDIYLSSNSRRHVLGRLVGNEDTKTKNRVDVLTRREMEVFVRTGRGFPPRQIAAELELSVKTIETYREKIKDKLGLRSSHEVLRYAIECVLFDFHNTTGPSADYARP